MRKSNFILVVLTIGLFGSCKSSEPHTEYQTIEHKGVKDMRITEIAIDTIAMDASATSLEGKWMLYDGKLYFSDYNLVAIQEYDLDYPETTTFDNYSEVLKKHREEYGYYTDIKVVGAYVFRGYKLKKDNGYGFQIYLNNDLIGQVQTKEKMSILGNHGNVFYGALSTDIENERFNLIRFKF